MSKKQGRKGKSKRKKSKKGSDVFFFFWLAKSRPVVHIILVIPRVYFVVLLLYVRSICPEYSCF